MVSRGKIDKRFAVATSCIVVVIVLLAAGITYYLKVYSNPERTFWATIDNSLSTPSVTKQLSQKGESGSTDNLTQLVFNSSPYVNYQKKITDSSTQPASHLTLEGIGTLSADYNRYTHIDHSGRTGNYASVYKTWLKSDQPQLFSSSVFGPVLFGNLSQPQRANIENLMKPAYSFKAGPSSYSGLRQSRDYSLTVNMQKYALAARYYAKSLGMPAADQISSSNYAADSTIKLIVHVDVLSRQITQVDYQGANTSEKYSSYGIVSDLKIPAKTVSLGQFQDTLNSIKD